MRRLSAIAIALLVGGCVSSGYSRADLMRNCLRVVDFGAAWVHMDSLPQNSLEIRTIAFRDLPGLDPANPPPREEWFRHSNGHYLICYLGDRTSCGQIATTVLKATSGWVLDSGEITVC